MVTRKIAERPMIAARDGIEAQHGHNDVFPGDPYPAPACEPLATITICIFPDRSTMKIQASSGDPAELLARARAALEAESGELKNCPFHSRKPLFEKCGRCRGTGAHMGAMGGPNHPRCGYCHGTGRVSVKQG